MNLQELKEEVDAAIKRAIEDGNNPETIKVTLQIDGLQFDTPTYESVWADENVELHYDNNMMASGCVLLAVVADTFSLATTKLLREKTRG